jgi:hypothetical protein
MLSRPGPVSLTGDRADISNDRRYESNDSLEIMNCSSEGDTGGRFLKDEDEFSRPQKFLFSMGDG